MILRLVQSQVSRLTTMSTRRCVDIFQRRVSRRSIRWELEEEEEEEEINKL